jgi:hypothetical protein
MGNGTRAAGLQIGMAAIYPRKTQAVISFLGTVLISIKKLEGSDLDTVMTMRKIPLQIRVKPSLKTAINFSIMKFI